MNETLRVFPVKTHKSILEYLPANLIYTELNGVLVSLKLCSGGVAIS